MKQIKKPNSINVSDNGGVMQHKAIVKLHVVSETERELYRVPSYGYLIP